MRCARDFPHGSNRIDAKAAHAVDIAEGKRVDRNPEMRDPPRDASAARDRFIVDGFAGDEGIRLGASESEKVADARNVVLAVRIDLNRVTEAMRFRPGDAVENGGALAAIRFAAQELYSSTPTQMSAICAAISGALPSSTTRTGRPSATSLSTTPRKASTCRAVGTMAQGRKPLTRDP